MTQWGLGRTGWAVVALVTLLNWYAFLPIVSGGAFVAAALATPVASFMWVHFLKSVLVVLFGSSESDDAAANAEPDA